MRKKENPQRPDGLLEMIQQIKANYIEEPEKRKRGSPRIYAGVSIILLAVVAVIMKTFKTSELHRLVSQDEKLREEIELEALPHRTTVGRRLKKLLPEVEAQVNELGQQIVKEVKPEKGQPEMSAIYGRMYQAQGPRWHKQDREKGIVPPELRNVDTQSSWLKSGYRGWVQGYHLILQGLAFPYPVPVPIFAAWRANSEAESTIVAKALAEGKLPITDLLLGDQSFGGADLVAAYREAGGWLLTSKELPKVRRSWKTYLFAYRKETIEILFQRVIQAFDLKSCPVKGLTLNGAFVIASVWLYQNIFLSNYRDGKPLGEIKAAIEQARWRLAG